jgi:hypothetical protein
VLSGHTYLLQLQCMEVPVQRLCGYSSVSCSTHDIPRHQSPKHTVQILHITVPPHCITAGRENVQNDANQTSVVVIGVKNITTMESSMLLHLFFVMVVRLKIVKRERKVHHEMHLSCLVGFRKCLLHICCQPAC